MELLNGKAKEMFLEYYWQTKIKTLPMTICKREDLTDFFETVVDIFQNAIIIEWLDSVGLFIEIEYNGCFYTVIKDKISIKSFGNYKKHFSDEFNSRQEATTEAIKKAVELINQTQWIKTKSR